MAEQPQGRDKLPHDPLPGDGATPESEFSQVQRHGMATNLANWDARVPVHTGPNGYDLERLVANPGALSDVVAFDRRFLGELQGLDLVHLQCHLGTDTVSLAKLGASITGLDFSAPALAVARDLAERCGFDARYVEGNVYDAAELLGATYDVVYTGVGAINWLPDLRRWARTVAALLKPGGLFHITDGHPSALIFAEEATADDMRIFFPYFDGSPAIHWSDSASYAGDGTVESPDSVEWAHDLGTIVQSLIDAGLVIERFVEHRELAWELFPWMEQSPDHQGWFRLPEPLRQSVPLSYTIQARKSG